MITYDLPNFDFLIEDLPTDALLGAWVAREFEPIESQNNTPVSPTAVSTTRTLNHTVTYTELGMEQEHKITLKSTATYSDLPEGGFSQIIYRLQVTGRSMTCEDDPTLNSSSSCYLHVDETVLRQTTIPNAAFVSETINGNMRKVGISSILSANIGIAYGALSASISIPVSFSGNYYVDINDTYEDFVNDSTNNRCVRSIRTKANSAYRMSAIGHYFSVSCTIADFGNGTASSNSHKGVWDITITNYGNMESEDVHLYHTANMAITS